VRKPDLTRKKVKNRALKEINWSNFKKDLTLIEVDDSLSIDEMVTELDKSLKELLDKYAPLKERTITIRRKFPWFSHEAAEGKQKMRRCEKRWQSQHTADLWKLLKFLSLAEMLTIEY
jgi:hypothetical protein